MNQPSSQIFESRPHSTGELLALTLQFFVRNLSSVMGITLVILGPILLFNLISFLITPFQMNAIEAANNDSSGMGGAQLLFTLVSWCGSLIVLILSFLMPWMEGALTHNLIERLLGREPSVGDSYRATRPRFWSLWGSNALAQLIISIPFVVVYFAILFAVFGAAAGIVGSSNGDNSGGVFAGVMLAICTPISIAGIVFSILMAINFLFRTPVIVGEGVDAIRALSRSKALASGNRWRLLLRMVLLYIFKGIFVIGPMMAIASMILFAAFSSSTVGRFEGLSGWMIVVFVVMAIISVVVQLVLTPIETIFVGMNYLDMRMRNENLVLQMAGAPTPAVVTPIQPATVQPTSPSPAVYTAPAKPVGPITAPVGNSVSIGPIATELPTPHSPPISIENASAGQKIGILFNRIRNEGASADLLNDLGLAYMDVGDLGGALDAFSRARQLNPTDADIAYNLMLLHLNRKDKTAARASMQDYLRLETNTDDLERVRNNPKFKELL